MNMRTTVVCLMFLAGLVFARQIFLCEHEIWWPRERWNALWCSVIVKDDAGDFVKGLKAEDFQIVERAYDEAGRFIAQKTISPPFESSSYTFGGPGFWEKSINSDRLDIAFFIDGTGSMEPHIENIKEQLHAFLDRLIEANTDFRMFVSLYETEGEPEWPIQSYQTRFFGPTMVDEIRRAIDEIDTWGEWWNLTWGYDTLLWCLNLNWRDDARKIVVIITDVYTDSVYGPNWYFSSGCVSSMSAVDIALREKNIQLYYCQPLEDRMAKVELAECYSPKVNAKVKENNFDALERFNPSVKRLDWPFDQNQIGLKASPLVDSRYYLAWVSDWTAYRSVSKVEVEVLLKGSNASTSFAFQPQDESLQTWVRGVKFFVHDETGCPLEKENNVSMALYRTMGELDRIGERMHGTSDKSGVIDFGSVKAGRYYYIIETKGRPDYQYYQLLQRSSGFVEITKHGATTTQLVAETYARDTELYRARGLLVELKKLKISNENVSEFSLRAEAWIRHVQEDGITLQEMEALKRFNVTLGAMINCAAYADAVQENATEDVGFVLQRATAMVRKAGEITELLQSSKHIFTSAFNTLIDIITANWSGIAAHATIEGLIDRLADYVKNELVDDIMSNVKAKLFEVLNDPSMIVDYFEEHVRNWVRQGLDPSQVFDVAHDFIKNSIVTKRFTIFLEKQLEDLLSNAMNFVDTYAGEYWNYYERSMKMKKDFEEMRKELMSDLYNVSHDALIDQPNLDDWKSALIVFGETIPLIVEFIDIVELRYPELAEVKKALKGLYDVFDATGTLTKTYEMALKVNHLDELKGRIERMLSYAF